MVLAFLDEVLDDVDENEGIESAVVLLGLS